MEPFDWFINLLRSSTFRYQEEKSIITSIQSAVILLPAHPTSFAQRFLFQRVPGCNNIADLSLKIVFWTHKFAVGTH